MIRYFWPADDEQLAGQWADSHTVEDAEWWVGAQKCGAVLALAAVLTATAVSTTLASSVFSQFQDDPAGSLVGNPLVYEEYWQNPVAPVNWPQPSVFTDNDHHPTFVESFQTDEDFWRNPVAPVAASNTLAFALPFTEQDQTPQFPTTVPVVDESDFTLAPPWEPTWTLLFFLDDGSTVPAFQPDEDFWVNPVAPQLWPTANQPFRAADDDSYAQSFLGNDEHYWWPQIPSLPDGLRLFQPFLLDQHEPAGNLTSFTEEVYWQNPTPPVAASLYVLRQDAFDTQDPTGSLTLILDDGFQPNFIAPVPAGLTWPQQWTFDEQLPAGSLYTLRDEDFWQNPVAPVVWPQVSPFVFDESIQTFVSPFQPDEDFWNLLVAPVPPSNYLAPFYALPGEHEDDTPVLSTPIPPVPPFCPLPPAGPDGDISISVFGGVQQPTLALFCRICNSGKPLVVRADYAIWCQDCCAFVSKQDTYQGTVRGPGQFRSIF